MLLSMGSRRIWFWVLIVGLGFLAAAAVAITYHLGILFSAWQPIFRPHGVSAEAVYVSTVEDGAWFDCRVDGAQNVDVCRAWDYEGKLLIEGRFRLECEGRAATVAELRPTVVDGRGSEIYLFGKDGSFSRKLVRIERAREPCIEGR